MQCINDIGEMVEKCGNANGLWCDYFLENAKKKFGEKRVNGFIDEMCEKSGAIKTVIDTLRAEEAAE